MTLDDKIEKALLSGKTSLKIIKSLKTHSQRIEKVKEERGIICITKSLGYRYGFKSKYVKQEKENCHVPSKKNRIDENLNGWF